MLSEQIKAVSSLNILVKSICEKSQLYLPVQLDLLKDLTAIDSGTGNIEGNRATVERICQELTPLEADIQLVEAPEAGLHILARLNSQAKRKIILSAHLDTVFEKGLSAQHPFRVENGRAYGLGIVDCKGGVAVSLFGLRIAKELDLIPPDLEIVILYNCDEETGSHSSRYLFKQESQGADYAFVFEPGRALNGLITARKGCAQGSIKVSEKAVPEDGSSPKADASLLLIRSILSLNSRREKNTFKVGRIRTEQYADVLSDAALADFFVTFSTTEELNQAKNILALLSTQNPADGCTIKTTFSLLFPPMERTPGNREAYELVKKAGHLLGFYLPEEISAGSSDACWYSFYGVPTIDGLGPFMHDIHTVDESLLIKTIRERTELLAMTLATL